VTRPEPAPTLHRFLVEPEDAGARLDVFLADLDDPPLTRSQVKRCLSQGEVTVNGARVKAGYKLRPGDQILWAHAPPRPLSATPQDIPITVLYEDALVAIVDKPAGMVVHPSFGHPDGTLVNALLHHMGAHLLAEGSDPLRPGIVHRIDKDTSGALAVTKSDAAHAHLSALFASHDIERAYRALVVDQGLADSGTFDTLHGRDRQDRFKFSSRVPRGKRAVSHYAVLERFDSGAALVECRLETGRTHQIRVHFSDAGCPLLGDTLYGGKAASDVRVIGRQALHAHTLGFTHADGRDVSVTSPYPDDFAAALDALRAGKRWRK
jgi:23S rRNA pseudouridine1911/1915/1917 synthase